MTALFLWECSSYFQQNMIESVDGTRFMYFRESSQETANTFLHNAANIAIKCVNISSPKCSSQASLRTVEHNSVIMSAIRDLSAGVPSPHECLGLILHHDFNIERMLFIKIPCQMEFSASFMCEGPHDTRFVRKHVDKLFPFTTLMEKNNTRLVRVPTFACPLGSFITHESTCFNIALYYL